MPSNITKEEIKLLANKHGKIRNWDSDREAKGYIAPYAVLNYIEDRDAAWEEAQKNKHMQKCQKFIEDEKMKEKVWADQRREKLEKEKAAKAKREKAEREEFNLRYAKERRAKMLKPRKPPAPESDEEASQSQSMSQLQPTIPSTPTPVPKKMKSMKSKSVKSSVSKKYPSQSNKISDYMIKTIPKTTPSTSLKLSVATDADINNSYIQTPVNSTSTRAEIDALNNSSTASLKSVQEPPASVSVTTTITDTSINNASIQTPKPTTASTTITPYTGNHIDSSYLADSISTCAEVDYTKICAGCNNPFSNCYKGKWCRICLHRVLNYLGEKDFEGVSERSVRRVY